MSYSIKADSIFLRTADTQNVAAAKEKSYSISGVEQEKNGENVTVQISREAQLKLQNSTRVAEPRKKAGVTSAREQFEDEAYELRCWHSVLGVKSENYGDNNLYQIEDEWMRLDEPETYAEMRACWDKECQSTNEYDKHKYMSEAFSIHSDWVYRKCVTEDGFKCPLTGRSIIATLESLYSDETHDTTVDVFSRSSSSGTKVRQEHYKKYTFYCLHF